MNCKNSTQNALEVDILRSSQKNFLGRVPPDLSSSGEDDTPSPHPTLPGASILVPAGLDLGPPPFANPGSATAPRYLLLVTESRGAHENGTDKTNIIFESKCT